MMIAQYLGIRVAIVPLGDIAGNYQLLKRKRWIFVNEEIPENSPFFQVVVAHELGHAVLHRKENCAFIKNKTLLLTSGIEREANRFAAYLLITDDMLKEYAGCTKEQFCISTGYPKELIELRLLFCRGDMDEDIVSVFRHYLCDDGDNCSAIKYSNF